MRPSSYKIFLSTFFIAVTLLLITACNKDESLSPGEFTGDIGNPEISYIRLTEPSVSDSLLTGAFMGQLIAIVGVDLDRTVAIWFNDQQATLSPTDVTKNTILVNVPSTVPGEVTDKMKLLFANGSELVYDFSVNVPGPELDRIKSQHVETGDIAILHGDFFFEPITVTFGGDKEGLIANLEKTKIEVIVPEGVEVGEITITTNFGTVISEFIFRENSNIVVNADEFLHRSWNAAIADVAMGGGRVAPCSGNYVELVAAAEVGAWSWQNNLNIMYIAEDPETGRGNIPIFPGEANINEWGVRFEANVQFEWREIPIEIFFAEFEGDHGRDSGAAIARWTPWEATGLYEVEGWETVTIPLTEFNIDSQGNPNDLGELERYTNMTMMFFGEAENTHEPYIAIDNIRIVRL